MDSRYETQVKIRIQIHIPDHSDTETRRVTGYFGKPYLAIGGDPRICQQHILRMQSDMESQMEPFQIGIRLILHLLFLRQYTRYGKATYQ